MTRMWKLVPVASMLLWLTGTPASAQSCERGCDLDVKQCKAICEEHAKGGAARCKQACADEQKACLSDCKPGAKRPTSQQDVGRSHGHEDEGAHAE